MRGEELQALPEGNKYPRCGGLGVPLNAPEPDESPSGMRGNKDEAMKTYQLI